MPRELSEVIQDVLASETHDVYYAYDILLSDGITALHGAEAELTVDALNVFGTTVAVTPVLYEAKLQKDPSLKFTSGTAPNGGDIIIEDVAHTLGVLVSQIQNALEGATVTISKLFMKPDGNCEADIYARCVVRDARAEGDTTVISVIADTDSRNAIVSARELTQRCLAIFGDDRCGRPPELIAPGETCSNLYDDAENGCLAKRWQFRYWGIPILKLVTNLIGGGGWGDGTDGTGWSPGGGGGCPDPDSLVNLYLTKGSTVALPARSLIAGMIAIDSRGRCAVIEYVQLLHNVRKFSIECENGASLKCSFDHPVIRDHDDADGLAVELLSDDATALTVNRVTGVVEVSRIVRRVEIEPGDVVRISLANSASAQYSSGDAGSDLAIDGHNKPIIEMPIIN